MGFKGLIRTPTFAITHLFHTGSVTSTDRVPHLGERRFSVSEGRVQPRLFLQLTWRWRATKQNTQIPVYKSSSWVIRGEMLKQTQPSARRRTEPLRSGAARGSCVQAARPREFPAKTDTLWTQMMLKSPSVWQMRREKSNCKLGR